MVDFTNSTSNWTVTPQAYCREIASFLKTNPDAWCKGAGARAGNGSPIHPNNPHARMFCMLGLLERFIGDALMRDRVLTRLADVVGRHCGYMSVHTYNDIVAKDVKDIIARFEEAACAYETQPMQMPPPVKPAPPPSWAAIKSGFKVQAAFEEDMKEMLQTLVPWDSIMKKVERETMLA